MGKTSCQGSCQGKTSMGGVGGSLHPKGYYYKYYKRILPEKYQKSISCPYIHIRIYMYKDICSNKWWSP